MALSNDEQSYSPPMSSKHNITPPLLPTSHVTCGWCKDKSPRSASESVSGHTGANEKRQTNRGCPFLQCVLTKHAELPTPLGLNIMHQNRGVIGCQSCIHEIYVHVRCQMQQMLLACYALWGCGFMHTVPKYFWLSIEIIVLLFKILFNGFRWTSQAFSCTHTSTLH